MKVGVGAVPFERDQLEVAAKVPSVQAAQRQTVAKAGERGLEVALVKLRVEHRRLCGGVHVRPHLLHGAARNSAALIRHLDGDVLVALSDNNLDWRVAVSLVAVELNDGTQRVFQKLKDHVVQMRGHVHELEVLGAVQLDLGRIH
ncbi:hypothetical protein GGI05_002451 [Coemansia sp. RSA 2603]|nr:hypothetical protein GGI05_002451 [Coemansia sp. RSA 2603]